MTESKKEKKITMDDYSVTFVNLNTGGTHPGL
uniref:Uncharacterized protein n=1 Tax=Anguilla anguilla TaxID=7936 RepID=A0A0E9TF00_ANGAN